MPLRFSSTFLGLLMSAHGSWVFDQPLASQSYGELQVNRAVEGGPLKIAGQTYASGLGSHAVSEIPVPVPEDAVRFTGLVGVDDTPGAGKGLVKFRILAGSEVLWESRVHKCGDPAEAFDLAVSSVLHRMIYLQADDLGENTYDHADWVDLKWQSGTVPVPKPSQIFKGESFGLKPGATGDQSAAMRRALLALREAPGSTLKLEKGEYHFHATGALKRHFHISNHDQPLWHPVSIPLVDLKDVTIDGQGSLFLFHGLVQPVLFMDSSAISLRGIAVDYSIPHHSQGVLTDVGDRSYEVSVDPVKFPHEIRDGWFVFKGEDWEARDAGVGIVFDGATRAIVGGTSDFNFRGKLTTVENGKYRVEKNLASSGIKSGDVLTFRQGWQRPHPAVTIIRSRDVDLTDCPVHASHGMGVLGQRSENIRITGGGIFPRKETGRYFSTGADATHFSNCRGTVVVEKALFEGMMDDAINVHATCLRIEKLVDERTLRCRYVHGQSVGFETFLPGETLRFIQAKGLTPRDPRKVVAVRRESETMVVITLDAPVPGDIGKGDAVENVDWFPEVVFRGNTVRYNRARGSLFTTPRKVLVEDNTFESIAGSAILLAGDANGWYESGACHDVLIRNNRFIDNLTSRFQFTEALISVYPEIPDLAGQREFYHRNVRVENNRFQTFDVPLLFAISTSGLSFTGNTVEYNDKFPGWRKPPFILRRCEKVRISDNRVTRGADRIPWTARDVDAQLSDGVEVR